MKRFVPRCVKGWKDGLHCGSIKIFSLLWTSLKLKQVKKVFHQSMG
ncbi:Unknown protein sequence [Pseudomonas amygdali pv. lachrymans]|nr:Unknown protein sequence [Pseudomonas amygdali pv. lachrymans]